MHQDVDPASEHTVCSLDQYVPDTKVMARTQSNLIASKIGGFKEMVIDCARIGPDIR